MALNPAPSRPTRRSGLVRTSLREATAALATVALVAGVVLAGQDAGSAATPVAQSNGTFLSGSALGIPLSDIVSIAPADATNTGGASVVHNHPLDVTALDAVNVNVGDGINLLGDSGILRLGAVGQYAQANPDGSSRAASGAVTDSGAIAVDGSDDFPADATLSLAKLIGPALSNALGDVSLSTGALSASATQTADGTQAGNYRIAGLKLKITSPLISGLTSGLRSTLAALQPTVDALPGLIRDLPLVGALAQITGVPTLTDIVDELGHITSADGSIDANLTTGNIAIDVAALLRATGLDLNELDPDTELLPYVTKALTTELLPAISTALTGLTTQLTDAINGISVVVGGIPVSSGALAPVLNPVIRGLLSPVNTLVAGLGDEVVTPLADALTSLVSLRANVQTKSGGEFTERALRIGLLPDASTPAAIVNLASATVGPNAGPAAPVVPTASGLDPDHGPAAGGQTVTVTGTGFVPGSTSVTIGGTTVPAGAVTVTSPTTLTFTTPAHAPADVTVTVTTPGGTSTPGLAYTYDPAAATAPTATGLDPDHGPAAGGQTVTVTGTGFVPGSTSVTIGGTTVPAAAVTVTSPVTLTFTTPPHAPGDVQVAVTTPGGTSPGLGYTYDPAATNTPGTPTAGSIDPDHGPAAGGDTVTVTGTGFVPGSTTVTIGGTTVAADAVTVTSSTTLTFTTPPHTPGAVRVTVTTDGGGSNALTYTYDKLRVRTLPVITDPTDGTTTTDTTPVIRGKGTPRNLITVTEGGRTVCTAVVGADGRWSCRSAALSSGTHRIVTTEATPAGDRVGRSGAVVFDVNAVTASNESSGGLATTGLAIVSIAVLALVLTAAGGVLMLAGRRRREA